MDQLEKSAEGFESLVDDMRLREVVPKVNHARLPAAKRRKSERSRVLEDEFTLLWSEFEEMDPQQVWDMYLKEIVRRMVRRVRVYAKNNGVTVKFFTFPVPASTANRKVKVIERDGLFICLTVQRKGWHINPESPNPKVQEDAHFHIKMEVGVEDDEPRKLRLQRMDREMRKLNPKKIKPEK